MSEVTCPKCEFVNPHAQGLVTDACPSCGLIYAKFDPANAMLQKMMKARKTGDWSGIPRNEIPTNMIGHAASTIKVTTTPHVPGFVVGGLIGLVSAERVYGMNIFKDLLANVTDVVGGQSGTTQKALQDARNEVIGQVKVNAFYMGADAVIGIQLTYNELSGGGKSMLFVVATGTAVKLKQG